MSIQVNDFQWELGKNDTEYIRLLESSRDEWQKIAQNAIAKLKVLLKEQEPREPHYTKLEYMVYGMIVAVQHPECPKCVENGLTLWDAEIEQGIKFCKRCGQAVKWND